MKPVKLPLFAALSLALAAPLAPVQAQMPAPHGARMQDPAAVLGLTPGQKAQARALLQKAMQQMRAVSANQSLAPAVRAAKMRAIGQSINTQMMALLTPTQQAKARAMMQQRAQAMRQHGQGMR